MIQFACPQCQQGFKIEDKATGKKTKCPKCGTAIMVPSPASKPVPSKPIVPAQQATHDEGYAVASEQPTAAANDFLDDLIGPPAIPANENAQDAADIEGAVTHASVSYDIVCSNCGFRNSFMLKDESTTGRCRECDAALRLPSVKAAAYEEKKRTQDACAAKKEWRIAKIIWSAVAAIFLIPVLLLGGFVFYFEYFDPATIAESAARKEANLGGNMFASSKAKQIVSKKLTADYKVFAVPIHTSSKMLEAGANRLEMEYYVVMKGRTVMEIANSRSIEIGELCTKYGTQ